MLRNSSVLTHKQSRVVRQEESMRHSLVFSEVFKQRTSHSLSVTLTLSDKTASSSDTLRNSKIGKPTFSGNRKISEEPKLNLKASDFKLESSPPLTQHIPRRFKTWELHSVRSKQNALLRSLRLTALRSGGLIWLTKTDILMDKTKNWALESSIWKHAFRKFHNWELRKSKLTLNGKTNTKLFLTYLEFKRLISWAKLELTKLLTHPSPPRLENLR